MNRWPADGVEERWVGGAARRYLAAWRGGPRL